MYRLPEPLTEETVRDLMKDPRYQDRRHPEHRDFTDFGPARDPRFHRADRSVLIADAVGSRFRPRDHTVSRFIECECAGRQDGNASERDTEVLHALSPARGEVSDAAMAAFS